MDQMTINVIIAAAMAALGWFARTLWDGQREMQRDLNDLRVTMGKDYVSYEAMREIMREVKDDLEYIRDRVDAAAGHRRHEDA